MSQMLKSSGAMGLATLASRFSGLLREMVYANFMGTSVVASAFKLAFQIPNLFRRLLGEGALTAAFIPIFKEKERREGEGPMWEAANAVISGLIISSAVIVGLAILGISLALAFAHFREETRLMLRLLRIMFPYLFVICLTAIFMGILNSRGHFFIPAIGAAILNLVMICSVFWIAPRMGPTLATRIFGLAYGVLVAGAAQAAFQLPPLWKSGFRFHWVTPFGNDVVRRVVLKMVPGMMGVAAFQINVLLTNGMAFWVDPQIVASFDYAVRLMELPQGVFGISLATYLLPTLAGLAAEENYPEFRATLSQGLNYLFFVNAIASVLLVVLASPIVRLLFERGQFDAESTAHAAFALTWLAPGLVAFSGVNILARAFYALGDTQTPMKISVVCLGFNVLLAFWLILSLREGGLGLANTLSGLMNVSLLSYGLKRKMPKLDFLALRRNFLLILSSALAAGLVAGASSALWQLKIGHENLAQRAGGVFLPLALGYLSYLLLSLWMKLGPAQDIAALIGAKISDPS